MSCSSPCDATILSTKDKQPEHRTAQDSTLSDNIQTLLGHAAYPSILSVDQLDGDCESQGTVLSLLRGFMIEGGEHAVYLCAARLLVLWYARS